MPYTDPNNWLMGFLGFPFMLREGEEQPKMNKPRIIEGVVTAAGGALLSAIAMIVLGYVFLIPKIQQEYALLELRMSSTEAWQKAHTVADSGQRREDMQRLQSMFEGIGAAIADVKTRLDKHDDDLYVPRNGG